MSHCADVPWAAQDPASPDDAPAPPAGDTPPRPLRLVLRAVLWVLGAQVVGFAVAFLMAFLVAATDAWASRHGSQGWQPTQLAYLLSATVALQVTLLYAALRQGRSFGQGSLIAGLGAGPVRNRWLIALFVVLVIAWVLAYLAALIHFPALARTLSADVPEAFAVPPSNEPLMLIVRLLLIAVLAPLSEELFFRGWLWTALRRSWGGWATALVTGGIWLGVHAVTGVVRVPILVPAAILLSLARHYGGSVRASLPIHIANNATAMVIQIIAVAIGGH